MPVRSGLPRCPRHDHLHEITHTAWECQYRACGNPRCECKLFRCQSHVSQLNSQEASPCQILSLSPSMAIPYAFQDVSQQTNPYGLHWWGEQAALGKDSEGVSMERRCGSSLQQSGSGMHSARTACISSSAGPWPVTPGSLMRSLWQLVRRCQAGSPSNTRFGRARARREIHCRRHL